MSRIPADLRYLSSHEWVRIEGDGTATIGITDHAQSLLGDIVFVELPEVGTEYGAGEEAAVVESVKAASDVYCPLSGTVIEINDVLENAPETVNSDPYHDGWFFRIRLSDTTEVESLLDADGYAEACESDDH